MQALKAMENWLASPAENVQGKTNREVIEINLGLCRQNRETSG
jgi:hypothetical protein